jgi:hypothetical protein
MFQPHFQAGKEAVKVVIAADGADGEPCIPYRGFSGSIAKVKGYISRFEDIRESRGSGSLDCPRKKGSFAELDGVTVFRCFLNCFLGLFKFSEQIRGDF